MRRVLQRQFLSIKLSPGDLRLGLHTRELALHRSKLASLGRVERYAILSRSGVHLGDLAVDLGNLRLGLNYFWVLLCILSGKVFQLTLEFGLSHEEHSI